jgi:predicted AAA+ superfamily ATPase
LRVLCDRDPLPAHFLILGSASPDPVRASSESLAGRVETISISGFSLAEVGVDAFAQHWLRGGFPLSYLAATEADSIAWRKNFIQMFLERDLPQSGLRVPSVTLWRFWTMLAHYHGQIWNTAVLARSLGVSEPTTGHYLDILENVFMVHVLQPWYANLNMRQVKSPKVNFHDSGLLHYLLGIRSELDLQTHPKSGASWEGYAIEEVLKVVAPDEAYYWVTHNGAELDLMLLKDGHRICVECKRVDSPCLTLSMRTSLEDLELDKIFIIYPGDHSFPLDDQVTAISISELGKKEPGNLFDSF